MSQQTPNQGPKSPSKRKMPADTNGVLADGEPPPSSSKSFVTPHQISLANLAAVVNAAAKKTSAAAAAASTTSTGAINGGGNGFHGIQLQLVNENGSITPIEVANSIAAAMAATVQQQQQKIQISQTQLANSSNAQADENSSSDEVRIRIMYRSLSLGIMLHPTPDCPKKSVHCLHACFVIAAAAAAHMHRGEITFAWRCLVCVWFIHTQEA